MDTSDVYDLAIVGFGPTGAVAANLAGQAGLRTLVLDRAPDIFPMPRALGFDHEIMRVFQNLGLAGEIAPYVLPYRPSEYHGVDGRTIKRFVSQPEPHPLGWVPNSVFTQPPVDRALRARAATHASVQVALSCEVQRIAQDAEGVDLDYRDADGRSGRARARYLLACDGGGSGIRKQLGLTLDSLGFDEPWLVVDARVDPAWLHTLPDINIQYCEPARPATYVVGPGNHRRWEFMLAKDESPEDIARPETILRLVSRWIDPSHVELWRAATYVFHALVLTRWRVGRAFVLGDAAHMTPPFLAQGMCQGVRDAANLVWKLAAVLRGAAGDRLLDTYAQEREPHVRATTQITKTFGRLICERDEAAARARDAALAPDPAIPVATTTRQDLIPGLSCGLIDVRTAAAGITFPQPRVRLRGAAAEAAPVLLDDLTGAGFRLVLRAPLAYGTGLAAAEDALRPLAQRYDVRIVLLDADLPRDHDVAPEAIAVSEQDGVLADWMERHGCAAALVRPDHYVFGTAIDESGLRRLVDALLTGLGTSAATGVSPLLPCARSA